MFFERKHKLSNSPYSELLFLIICLSLRIIYCCSSSLFSSSIIFSVCLFVLLFPYSLAQNDVMIDTKSCIRSSFSFVCGFTTSILLSSRVNSFSILFTPNLASKIYIIHHQRTMLRMR